MERLTEKDQCSFDYKVQAKNLNSHCVAKDKKGYVTYYGEHIDKLAEYEDLEEQGLLLRLPCKVGDTLYVLRKNIITEEQVYDVQYRGITYQKGQRWYVNIGGLVYFEMDFGKTVFLTQAEAEQKLKEKESN